ncbi:hypothetical protein SAZ11_01820 [Streptomyces sp. FXJ1.4098]|nr:hypothetical protein [Streptomyces sp. FXJ1.4098]
MPPDLRALYGIADGEGDGVVNPLFDRQEWLPLAEIGDLDDEWLDIAQEWEHEPWRRTVFDAQPRTPSGGRRCVRAGSGSRSTPAATGSPWTWIPGRTVVPGRSSRSESTTRGADVRRRLGDHVPAPSGGSTGTR